jgi:DNA-binding NtrC family response regulator
MVSNLEAEIRNRVDAFVVELTELVRRAALEAVTSVLNEQMGGAPRRPGRALGAAPAKAAPAQAQAQAPRGASKRGEKRSQEELKALRDRVLEHIRANSGQGVEQISKALGTSTRELSLPIRRLLADKQISSKGEKRATRYFAR